MRMSVDLPAQGRELWRDPFQVFKPENSLKQNAWHGHRLAKCHRSESTNMIPCRIKMDMIARDKTGYDV